MQLKVPRGRHEEVGLSTDNIALVVLDERGYLPFGQRGVQLLAHLISYLIKRTSINVTTNVASGKPGAVQVARRLKAF